MRDVGNSLVSDLEKEEDDSEAALFETSQSQHEKVKLGKRKRYNRQISSNDCQIVNARNSIPTIDLTESDSETQNLNCSIGKERKSPFSSKRRKIVYQCKTATNTDDSASCHRQKVEKPNVKPGEAKLLVAVEDGIFIPHREMHGEEKSAEKPSLKLTEVQVYDENGTLVSLGDVSSANCGRKRSKTYLCGVALTTTHLDDKYSEKDHHIVIRDIEIEGETWITWYENGARLAIGISSRNFDFYILKPHRNYEKLFSEYEEKALIAKRIIQYLTLSLDDPSANFMRLLDELDEDTLEILLTEIDFVAQHVLSFDLSRDLYEPSLLENGCFIDLCQWAEYEIKDPNFEKIVKLRRNKQPQPVTAFATRIPSCIFDPIFVPDLAMDEANYIEESSAFTSTSVAAPVCLAPGCVGHRGKVFRVGDGVLLPNDSFDFALCSEKRQQKDVECTYDTEKYPERYRKNREKVRRTNRPQPFCVGQIMRFMVSESNADQSSDGPAKPILTKAQIRIFYRPEQTSLNEDEAKEKDWNLIYSSNQTAVVAFKKVMDRCAILPKELVLSKMKLDEYCRGGSKRFYFEETFDRSKGILPAIPYCPGVNAAKKRLDKILDMSAYPAIDKPLRTMDLFAGCGGLSAGLHQAGISQTCWAIEMEPNAAAAFKKNFPRAVVLQEDCSVLLKEAVEDPSNSRLPQKGQVDLIAGGPPCQGFSGLNRFQNGEAAQRNNGLIRTFLSYVDYYRPRFVIMENVKQLFSCKGGDVLKRILCCLRIMGYQTRHGVLQAGNFGVPQSRNRAIIIAAKQGESLPKFPTPVHTFAPPSMNDPHGEGAPYRMVTVGDAISDLHNCSNTEKMLYDTAAKTHYQRMIRENCEELMDHVTQPLMFLNEQRIKHIPKRPDADWRDLPNCRIRRVNSSQPVIEKLHYLDGTKAVCECQVRKGAKCTKQKNTLIPWCLPHTADKGHNHWSGLFGRLDNDGVFGTVVTDPGPMKKQGRVLHPTEDRVFSVREGARAQGFMDTFKFVGDIKQRYRQVGNAVPPPLAIAIGRQFAAVLSQKDNA